MHAYVKNIAGSECYHLTNRKCEKDKTASTS